jgi:hypothetical protein
VAGWNFLLGCLSEPGEVKESSSVIGVDCAAVWAVGKARVGVVGKDRLCETNVVEREGIAVKDDPMPL